MSLLILHRAALSAMPYQRWLDGYGGDVVLIASGEQLALYRERLPAAGGRYVHTEAIADYDDSPEVERRAYELARSFGVRDVVACQERDLERAARLRARLGLPGARPDDVAPYRDKWLMKLRAAKAGIAVAACALLEKPEDLTGFTDHHGFPVVVKPRRGAGSVGLRVLNSAREAAAFLAETDPAGTLAAGGEPQWLVEAFVAGEMCHVDGVVIDGRIRTMWPSQYMYALATFRQDRNARLDLPFDPADARGRALTAFAERVVAAFGGPRDFAFHIEVFVRPSGEPVLCEAACRAGGAGIRDVHTAMYGFDPAEAAVRAQLGLPLPDSAGPGRRLLPSRLAGQLLMMKRPGLVRTMPAHPVPFPWVTTQKLFAEVGQVLGEPTYSGDFLASYVVAAPDRQACRERMGELEAWLTQQVSVG